MRTPLPPPPPDPDTLSVQVGSWFKASATGKGVFVIGVTLVVLAGLGIAQLWLSLHA
jgi:hypothetical protein